MIENALPAPAPAAERVAASAAVDFDDPGLYLNRELTWIAFNRLGGDRRRSPLIAGIYGMNFENMPGLSWPVGYEFALGGMALVCIALFAVFKRSGWL